MCSAARLRLTIRVVVLTLCALSMISLLPSITGRAADNQQAYHSDTLGVSFQYPADWKVREQTATQTVIVSSTADDTALQNGQAPAGLIFSLTFSTFRQVGAEQVGDFSDRLKQVAGTPNATPQPTRVGGADGLSVDILDGNAGVAGRTAMLSVGQRRIAVLRGVATIQAWVHGDAQTQYQALADTLSFFPPKNAVNEDQIGRVLWQTADPRFSAFADIGATADGASVLATDPKNGLWTISANGVVGDVKTYDGMASYGSLALFQDGTRYIADPANHTIWLIQANGTPKKLLGGTVGNGRGAFGPDSPRVFAFGFQSTINTLDVSDKGTRIQVFDRGGDVLTSWNIPAVQDGAMAADPNGYVYVVGSNLTGILKVSAAGKIVAQDL
ncbi:MAG: NHL repeat-containing protein, partial [Aggregatilineales bacterium]